MLTPGPAALTSPPASTLASLEIDNQRLRGMVAAAGRLAELGRFAAKQIHELRQPLFAIKGLAQLLLDRGEIDVEEARDFARHIVEQSERLAVLVGDLRQMSLPVPATARRRTEVSPVLLRVASLLDWRFRRGVTLRTELAPELPPVAVTPHHLEQVLINLLSNALDAVSGVPAPIVQVRVQLGPVMQSEPSARPTVEIYVADNGCGIPRTARGRLFETFFTTKGEETGTGLGLAVSREIARGAGGELALLDRPGTWNEPVVTVFRLALPVAVEDPGGK